MAVTKDEWTSLTWAERIELAAKTLNVTRIELAKKLGVTRRTLHNWESHKSTPTEKKARIIYSLCVKSDYNDIKEESYMAMHSMSTDASHKLLLNASQSDDPVMLAMATHCIAVKQSALLSSLNPEQLIIRIVSVYGAHNGTKVQVQSTCYPVEKRAVEITIGHHREECMFVISTNMISNGCESKFAFSVSDRAMVLTAKRILAFLT